VNEFDDWSQTEILVKHLLMTQPELIFSAASRAAGRAVGDAFPETLLNGESLECTATTVLAKRS
jgi:hypothetical protein